MYVAGFRRHEEAKGHATGTRAQKYIKEQQELAQRFPQFASRSKYPLGKLWDKLSQAISGKRMAARRDTQRWKGKPWQEMFAFTPPDMSGDKNLKFEI